MNYYSIQYTADGWRSTNSESNFKWRRRNYCFPLRADHRPLNPIKKTAWAVSSIDNTLWSLPSRYSWQSWSADKRHRAPDPSHGTPRLNRMWRFLSFPEDSDGSQNPERSDRSGTPGSSTLNRTRIAIKDFFIPSPPNCKPWYIRFLCFFLTTGLFYPAYYHS